MRTFKTLTLLALMLFLAGNAQAQRRYNYFSAGVSLGIAHYQGDLDDNGFDWWNVFNSNENKNVGNPLDLIKLGLGGQVNYHFHPHMFVRFGFNQGWIGADDKFNDDKARQYRNLHFRSHVTEVSAQLVYEFFATERHYRYRPNWSPYVLAGIAVFNFSPKAQPNSEWINMYPGLFENSDEWVALQPLGTEGQYLTGSQYPEPYKLTQVSVPIGIGVRRKINDRMDIRFEMAIRKTFTDYLDDVSGNVTPVDYNFSGDVRPTGAYASMNDFFNQGQVKAGLFSDRSGYTRYGTIYDPISPSSGIRPGGWTATGEIRGNINDDDWYAFTGIALTYILDKPDRCPKFK